MTEVDLDAVPGNRLVEVMLAMSGRMDVEEPAAVPTPEAARYCAHASLERLAMLGMSLGL